MDLSWARKSSNSLAAIRCPSRRASAKAYGSVPGVPGAHRVVNVTAGMAIAVNAEGYREVLEVDIMVTSHDGAGWLVFLRCLVSRDLSGVQLIVSDAHEGIEGRSERHCRVASWCSGVERTSCSTC